MLGFVFSLTSDFELLLMAIRFVTSDVGNKIRGYLMLKAGTVTPFPACLLSEMGGTVIIVDHCFHKITY